MTSRMMKFVIPATLAGTAILWSQDQGGKQMLQQRITELKQSIAQNKAKLQKYQWTETTQLSLKGEVKKTQQKLCRYGPDGQVQKTPIGEPAPPPKEKRGLRGKIVEKKVDELKDYMERVANLVSRYVPPDPQKIQACFQAGNANLNLSSGGAAALALTNYVKTGDQVTFDFNRTAKKLESYKVNTYLDSPQDAVDLTAQFSSLPDGTNYVSSSVLNAPAKKIQINIKNSDYTPVSQ